MKTTILGLAAIAALSLSAPAQAAVTYTFTGDYTSARDINGDPIQTDTAIWTYTTASFINSFSDIVPQSCITNNVNFACSATQRVEPDPNSFGAGGDYIGLNLDDLLTMGSGTGFYFFQPGALGAVGLYSNAGWPNPGNGFGNAGSATLQVSGSPEGVPEPGTWAMMLAGFGLIGAAMRRRLGQVGRLVKAAGA